MGTVLRVAGAIWALIGVGKLMAIPGDFSQGIPFGIGINIVLFVIPGIVAYRIGSGTRKRQAASDQAVPREKSD